MADFHAAYPDYHQTRVLDELRATEYSYLDENGHVYLDYTGAGLAARSQLRAHSARIGAGCFGNPHSENPTSSASARLVEQARAAVLRHFNTTADDYAVVFTPNATGACRLVGEAYPFRRLRRLVLTADNHNSVNGLREFARARDARVAYVPVTPPELRVNETAVLAALSRGCGGRPGLFAYPAQSNFSGVQHPLRWVHRAQEGGYDVLLDAAAYVPANRLDLSVVRPEFVAMSWYKVFGYPTGVGALLIRRDALPRLRRPWFSGGTLNFLSIPDVTTGLEWIGAIGTDLIRRRVSMLTGWLLDRLGRLRHGNGAPMIRLFGPAGTDGRGGTVSFNFLDPAGRVIDERAVTRDSAAAGISLRTGCFCNPGAAESVLGLDAVAARGGRRPRAGRVPGRDVVTIDDYLRQYGVTAGGAVRVSLGLASNVADVEAFLDFAERAYRDRGADLAGLAPRARC